MSDAKAKPPEAVDLTKVPKGLAKLLSRVNLSPELQGYIAGREDAIDWRLVVACAFIFTSIGAISVFLYMQYWILIAYEIPRLLEGTFNGS